MVSRTRLILHGRVRGGLCAGSWLRSLPAHIRPALISHQVRISGKGWWYTAICVVQASQVRDVLCVRVEYVASPGQACAVCVRALRDAAFVWGAL